MKRISEGLKELKLAVRQHHRDVLRAAGGANTWKKETKKIFKPASIALSIAGVASSPAISLLMHGHLKPSTMAAVAATSATILPAFGIATHLRDIVKIYQKRMKMKKGKLMESYFTSVSSAYHFDKDTPIDVYKNPTKNELHKLIHQSEFKRLRGILSHENDGNHAYVWDAGRGSIHSDMKEKLNLFGKRFYVNFFKNSKTGNIDINQEYHTSEEIKKHDWVKKTLPNAEVFYS